MRFRMRSRLLLILLSLVVGLLACPTNRTDPGGGGGGGGGNNGGDGGDGGGGGNGGGSSGAQTIENPPNWGVGEEGTSLSGVGVQPDGSIALNQSTATDAKYMWLADTDNGMVSKFDLNTGQELARYRSVIGRHCAEGQSETGCNEAWTPLAGTYWPSRTAIDAAGNAWIANRGGGLELINGEIVFRPGALTKIAAERGACRNGGQNTSQRIENGDGTFTITMPEDDDCVLFSTEVCTEGPYSQHQGARALAIDAESKVWVGCYAEEAAYQLNSTNGQIERGPIDLGRGMRPYGAIVDGEQNLWLTNESSSFLGPLRLQGINTRTGEVLNRDPSGNPIAISPQADEGEGDNRGLCSSYGLAVDSQNRIWFAGYGQGNIVACFYNHYATRNSDRWDRCELPDGNFYGRGIVVANEQQGNHIYMSSESTGRLVRFSWDDLNRSCQIEPIAGRQTTHLRLGNELLGVGFDREGNPWAVERGHRAARLNLNTGQVSVYGSSYLNTSYYTYSDFTGHQHRNFTAPQGSYRQIIEGCPNYSSWKSLSWVAHVPEGTQLSVYVQVANSREGFPSTYRHAFTTSPADLSEIPKSSFIQLEFVLESSGDRQSSPALQSYKLEWACEPGIA